MGTSETGVAGGGTKGAGGGVSKANRATLSLGVANPELTHRSPLKGLEGVGGEGGLATLDRGVEPSALMVALVTTTCPTIAPLANALAPRQWASDR